MVFFLLPFVWADRPPCLLSRRLSHFQKLRLSEAPGLGQVTNRLTMPRGGQEEGNTGPLPSVEERRGHLAEGFSLKFTGFFIPLPSRQESAHGWGICNSL